MNRFKPALIPISQALTSPNFATPFITISSETATPLKCRAFLKYVMAFWLKDVGISSFSKQVQKRCATITISIPFSIADLKQIFEQLAEVKITTDSIEYIHKKYNRFRQIVQLINQLEIVVKENNLDEINLEVIQQLV